MPEALKFSLMLLDDLVPLAIRGVVGAAEALAEGREALRRMTAEDRDPTPEEWDAVNVELSALRRRLRSE